MERLGAVVIGRNEGDRFIRCLESLVGKVSPIVYVDSGSTDGSIEYAKSQGVEVVDLDTSVPFTAARARNAGYDRLRVLSPNTELVMFVDGDCQVDDGWFPAATEFLAKGEVYAVVCGRRRERFPDASIYNYLCDVEWDTPIGDAKFCGGDAVIRVAAFDSVGGFDPTLIAGEEPELCVRLRAAGWKIRRIDQEMTLHDANMTRFSQWWTRTVRSGHAFAEGAAMHGDTEERHFVRESRRAVLWGLVLPAVAVGGAPLTRGASLGLGLLYPLSAARTALRLRRERVERPWTTAAFMVLSKVPEAQGWLRYHRNRWRGERSTLIEYK